MTVKRALEAVQGGAVGNIVAVEITCSSEYPPYEGGPLPPWYRDAGYPFRDLGVRCIDLVRELLGPIEDVEAQWRSLGGDPNLAFDDWRAIVRCARGSGHLRLSWSAGPQTAKLIIHGTKGVRRIDPFAMFHGKRASTPLRQAATRLVGAVADSIQPLIDVRKLVRTNVHAESPPPVSGADAVHWADKIARAADADHAARVAKLPLSDHVPYLVTGASGSVGTAIVKRLRADGHRVRVFVRRIPERVEAGVEYCLGNLGDPAAVDRAVRGAATVIHAGASMTGGWPQHKCGTVTGTQNVIDACTSHGAKQLVYLSSMSVIDWAGSAGNGPVGEGAALEPRPDERGAYTRAKLEAEQLVVAAARRGLPCVILRPGQIFGGGIPLINGAVARNAGGRWLVLGDGTLELPLVYIDDVVDSIVLATAKNLHGGEIIQIIDPVHLTQQDVLALAGGSKPVLRVPRALVFALGKLSEVPLGRRSPVAVYRLKSALARLHYDSDRAARLLGWRPRVGAVEGIRRVTAT